MKHISCYEGVLCGKNNYYASNFAISNLDYVLDPPTNVSICPKCLQAAICKLKITLKRNKE